MALSVKTSRAGCLITHTDGVAETTINVQPEDDTDTIITKFKKALELEGRTVLDSFELGPILSTRSWAEVMGDANEGQPPHAMMELAKNPDWLQALQERMQQHRESGQLFESSTVGQPPPGAMTDEEAARIAASVPDTVLPPEEAAGGPTGPELLEQHKLAWGRINDEDLPPAPGEE